MERFGIFDAAEKALDAVVDVLMGTDEVSVETLRTDLKSIITPIRTNMKLSNALQVGAAGGAVSWVRRLMPGANAKLGTIPNGIPLLGGMKIRRF